MGSWEFPATGPITVHIRVPDGDVTVAAVPAQLAKVTVESSHGDVSEGKVQFDDGTLSVLAPMRAGLFNLRSHRWDVTVAVPLGSSCRIDTAAADVRCTGELGELTIQTASGDIAAAQAEKAQINTASGDVRLNRCGDLRAKSVSGDVHLGRADGDAACESVSGDVWIGEVHRGRTEAQTTSGDITVTVVPGLSLRLDLSTMSGDLSSDLGQADGEGGVDATISCRSISGDLRLLRATQPEHHLPRNPA
jgi:DUF4097 and DUF4098 domain-containing protein YvlB